MAFFPSLPEHHGGRFRRALGAIGLLGLVGLASSCQQRPFAFWRSSSQQQGYGQPPYQQQQQQQAWNNPYPSTAGGYATEGYGQPRGQRIQPNGSSSAQPYAPGYPSYQAPLAQPTTSSSGGSAAPSRWNSGNSWEHRAQQQPNWRGSGVGWQRGHRKTPGSFSRRTKKAAAPSVAANSWQTAPYYANTPASSGLPPSGYGPPTTYDPYASAPATGYGYDMTGSGQASSSSYVIQKGDTLTGIAKRHQVSLSELLRANGLTQDQIIFPGQPLTIPR